MKHYYAQWLSAFPINLIFEVFIFEKHSSNNSCEVRSFKGVCSRKEKSTFKMVLENYEIYDPTKN